MKLSVSLNSSHALFNKFTILGSVVALIFVLVVFGKVIGILMSPLANDSLFFLAKGFWLNESSSAKEHGSWFPSLLAWIKSGTTTYQYLFLSKIFFVVLPLIDGILIFRILTYLKFPKSFSWLIMRLFASLAIITILIFYGLYWVRPEGLSVTFVLICINLILAIKPSQHINYINLSIGVIIAAIIASSTLRFVLPAFLLLITFCMAIALNPMPTLKKLVLIVAFWFVFLFISISIIDPFFALNEGLNHISNSPTSSIFSRFTPNNFLSIAFLNIGAAFLLMLFSFTAALSNLLKRDIRSGHVPLHFITFLAPIYSIFILFFELRRPDYVLGLFYFFIFLGLLCSFANPINGLWQSRLRLCVIVACITSLGIAIMHINFSKRVRIYATLPTINSIYADVASTSSRLPEIETNIETEVFLSNYDFSRWRSSFLRQIKYQDLVCKKFAKKKIVSEDFWFHPICGDFLSTLYLAGYTTFDPKYGVVDPKNPKLRCEKFGMGDLVLATDEIDSYCNELKMHTKIEGKLDEKIKIWLLNHAQ